MGDQPEIKNFDTGSLVLRDGNFADIILNASGAVTYPEGQVLAFNGTTGKYAETISGTAAVANAKAILAEEAVFSGSGDKLVRAVIGGVVAEEKLFFNGSDTPDTIPAAVDSFRVQLRDYGIVIENPAEQQLLGNQ